MEKNIKIDYDVAIIGFGATGVSFLKSLQSFSHEQSLKNLRIAIISEEKTLALGKAFQQCDEIHRVNTPPELMSIQEEDILGFKHWLALQNYTEKYPPRHLFAKYLTHVFNDIKKDKNFTIDIIEEEAIDISKEKDNFLSIRTSGYTIKSKRVVLCLGAITTSKFKYLNEKLVLPHQISRLNNKQHESIAVAGTGLTAIDCIRHLKKQGIKKVFIFSRKNMLPTPITVENKYIPKHFVWQNIKNELISTPKENRLNVLITLFQKEISLLNENEYNISNSLLTNEKYNDYFNYILNKAKTSNLPIQDLLASTRRFSHKIWKLLCDEDKNTFLQNFGSYWAAWRHPIPLFILEEIQKDFNSGFIEVVKSAKVTLTENHILLKNEKNQKSFTVNALVDATGGTIDIKTSESLLIKNLLTKNIVIPHICGGIKTDSLNFKVKNNYNIELYNLGPLSKGDLLSTNAFWYNSKCANELAYLFANSLKEVESL